MNRPGFFYQPQTDARSWAEMRLFFDEDLRRRVSPSRGAGLARTCSAQRAAVLAV